MKASDLFVRALENEGVKYVFGIPGEENLDILESLRNSDIEMIVTRHEQAAGFMAATVGRLTGRVGVCMSTLGPGATNLTTAAAYGLLGGMPLLLLTGQKPIKKSKQGMFQIIDVVDMMTPLTKSAKQITHGNQIPSLVRDAVRLAESGRPGPVHFELPEDIAREETDVDVFPVVQEDKVYPNWGVVSSVAGLIRRAKSPLLLMASGNNRDKRIAVAAKNFVDKTGLYFLSTQMGKGVLDERHEHFMGTAALSAHDSVHCAIEKSDLIILVGHNPMEKPPFIMDRDKTVVHVNYSSASVNEVYFPQYQLVGDIAASFNMLTEELEGKLGDWDFSYFEKVKEEFDVYVKGLAADDSFPLHPARVVADVRELMPDDGVVCLDNGMYKIWFARHYLAYERHTILLDNALATMGAGLPSAMATKLVYPNRKVISVCGDGGFMMNSQEIETAVRLEIDLVVLVLNDNAFGMIKWKQENMGFKNFSLDLGNPDFVKYAEAYGANGYRIESCDEFKKVLAKCLDSKGVHLIEVPLDYSVNSEVSASNLMAKGCPL